MLECGLGEKRGQKSQASDPKSFEAQRLRLRLLVALAAQKMCPAPSRPHLGPVLPKWLEHPEPSVLSSPQISGSEPAGPAEKVPLFHLLSTLGPLAFPIAAAIEWAGRAPLWGPGATVAEARTDCPFCSGNGWGALEDADRRRGIGVTLLRKEVDVGQQGVREKGSLAWGLGPWKEGCGS